MRDSERNQILEACGNVKSAADLMRFLMHVFKCRRREFPDDAADSHRMLLSFSYSDLEEKIGYSVRTVARAVQLIKQRGFIRLHNKIGQVNLIEIKEGAISRWLQQMPLFEGDEIDVTPYSTHAISNTQPMPRCHRSHDTVAQVPMTRCHRSSYICAPIPPHPQGKSDDDETCENKNQESKTDVHTVPASPPEESDRERQDILDQCEEAGLHPETTEALLRDHTRQTIKAALAHRIVRQKRREHVPSGFIISFCRNPKRWEHGMDDHGCWVPLKVLAARKKQRLAVKARDRPELTAAEMHRRSCALAWESLTNDQQRQIREQINQQHPESPPARQFMLCQEAALEEKKGCLQR